MSISEVHIESFLPLSFDLPDSDPVPVGTVTVFFPSSRVSIGKLDLLDWDIVGTGPALTMTLAIKEPMPRSMLAAFITEAAADLQEMHEAHQRMLNENGPVYGRGQVPAIVQAAALADYMNRSRR